MAETTKQFKLTAPQKRGNKTWYPEVGRVFVNESEKGTSLKVVLHHLPGVDYVAFPVEPKEEAAGEGK